MHARTHARRHAGKQSCRTLHILISLSPPLPSPPSALNLTGSYMCFLAILEPRLLLHNQSSSLQASWKGGGRGWKGLLKLLCVPWGVYSDDIHLPIPLHFSFFFSSCSCPSLSFSLFLHALPSPLSHFHISLFFPSFFFFFFSLFNPPPSICSPFITLLLYCFSPFLFFFSFFFFSSLVSLRSF